jgi:hypothetical protein
MNWEVSLTTGVLERCGPGLVGFRCRADPVRRPNGQERCGDGGQLLAFGCLGFQSAKLRSGPVELQACESVLGSWLSGVAQGSGEAPEE